MQPQPNHSAVGSGPECLFYALSTIVQTIASPALTTPQAPISHRQSLVPGLLLSSLEEPTSAALGGWSLA